MRWVIEILKVSFALAIVSYLVVSGRLNLTELKSVMDPTAVMGGIFILILSQIFIAERWRFTMGLQGVSAPRTLLWRLHFVGIFFNTFVPGGVGGDVVKAVMIAKRNPENRARVASSVVFDRVFGLWSLLMFAILSFALEPHLVLGNRDIKLMMAFLSFVFLGLSFFFLFLWLGYFSPARVWAQKKFLRFPRLHKLTQILIDFRPGRLRLLQMLFVSFFSQLLAIGFFIFIASFLSEPTPSLQVFFFAVPIGFMAQAVPISPGGVGVGQAAFYFLFTTALGYPSQIGVIGITAMQVLFLFTSGVVALKHFFFSKD